MEKLFDYLPRELVTFLMVTLFSLLIGLSQRKLRMKQEGENIQFGTDRTFTFIGILGYLLYMLDSTDYVLFMVGALILAALLAINYYVKQVFHHFYGVTTILIAFITYCLAPIVNTQPSWFSVTVVVIVLLLMEMKETFTELAQKLKNDEMTTLAKFLIIAGIILPILPTKDLLPGINLTPYNIWLSTVVVSGISYLSYLLQHYVFRKSGVLMSGILGGLYSSTATISVLARKSRKVGQHELPEYVSAMLLSIAMMFLRFLIFISIFSLKTLQVVYPYLLLLMFVSLIAAYLMHKRCAPSLNTDASTQEKDSSNPLEFKVALIFASLFVIFTILTHYTFVYLGENGLTVLSFVAGFSDITPFILNLLHGTDDLVVRVVAACILQAMVSNMLLNMIYAISFSGSRKPLRRWILQGFGVVIGVGIGVLLVFYIV